MAGKFEKKQKAGAPEWMATYGDMMTLLLCFFIMLFATSSIDTGKFEILLQAFNPDALLEFTGGDNILGEAAQDEDMIGMITEEIEYQNELSSLSSSLSSYVEENELSEDVAIEQGQDNLTIHFNSSMFFDAGKAKLKDEAKAHIKSIAASFPEDFDIQVEGHTDNLPVKNKEFASNWELSAMRGVSVLKFLIETCGIPQEKMSAAGFGEYRPIASNDTDEGRKQNRRVDIILFKSDR